MGSLFHRLQSLAESAEKCQTAEERIQHLVQAFALFSEETSHLQKAYTKLQERFKAVKSQLDGTTHYLESILSNMSQGILFIDVHGIIKTFNPAAEKLIEMPKEKMISQSYFSVFADAFFGFSMRWALEHFQAPERGFIFINEASVDEKECEIATNFVADQGVIVMVRDITEMRRLQRQSLLENRLKELGEMAASVAHEIRNPLGAIQGYASLLYRDLIDFPDKQKLVEPVIEGTKKLSRLVENILHYTRRLEINCSFIDLTQLIHELVAFVKHDPKFTAHVIEIETSEDKLFLYADKQLLYFAILNLLINAAEAMKTPGLIFVSLNKVKEQAQISIADTGAGIPPNHMDKIFSPFFTTKAHGTGLGLSESYKIISSHFGTIQARSQIGKGSVFIIQLPLKG